MPIVTHKGQRDDHHMGSYQRKLKGIVASGWRAAANTTPALPPWKN